jgi:nitrite reductase/ring-hydroxylating ferredoxin subunit
MNRSVTLCRLDAMRDGSARGFDPGQTGQDTVLVVRRGKSVYAYLNACPHQGGTPMAWRKDAYLNSDGSRIVCSAHGAQFDIATGVCTLGACLGQSLTAVSTSITNGEIHLISSEKQEAI